MNAVAFDAFNYVRKFEEAGFSRRQAEVQVEVLREAVFVQEEHVRAETATRADLRETELRLQAEIETTRADLRKTELRLQAEIETTRADLRETELRLQAEIEKVRAELKTDLKSLELRLLKWQIGIGFALVGVMAKGFGWLGF